MKRQTFSIQFYCRKSKISKNGIAPIEMSIIINGERGFITLPRKEKPEEFEKLINQKKNNEIKEYLNTWQQKIYDIQKEIINNNLQLTIKNIKQVMLDGGKVKAYTTHQLFKDFLKFFIEVKNGTLENYQKYQIVIDNFNEVIEEKLVEDLTIIDAQVFLSFLNKKYETSTIHGKITRIKSIFNYAIEINKLKTNPFNNIKTSKGEKPIEYLTEKEIEKIISINPPTECYERVKDLFIFQCACGLAYCDLSNLQPNDFQLDGETYFINKSRQKTNIEYTAVILPFGVDILKKYDFNLPKISNQKYNIYLKTIQGLINSKINFHSHLARKTYATLLLNKGIRLEIVSKCVGHSNTNITQRIYAKLQKNTIIDEIKEKLNK